MRVVNFHTTSCDVYIGRPGKGFTAETAPFGNPIVRGDVCSECGDVHPNGVDTLDCYEVYLRRRLTTDDAFATRFDTLQGKVLGCFCAGPGGLTATSRPRKCHGQVMLKVLAERRARGT